MAEKKLSGRRTAYVKSLWSEFREMKANVTGVQIGLEVVMR